MDPAEAPICHNSATGLARRLSKVFSSYESVSQRILQIVSYCYERSCEPDTLACQWYLGFLPPLPMPLVRRRRRPLVNSLLEWRHSAMWRHSSHRTYTRFRLRYPRYRGVQS